MDECRYPLALTDDQLELLLEGEVDAAMQEHLSQCPFCSARLAQMQNFEQALKVNLHRWNCPTPQELSEYHIGLLLPERAVILTKHLESCRRCRDELAEVERFLEDDSRLPPPRGLKKPQQPRMRGYELIARLLPMPPSLALRGRRGPTRNPLQAEVDDITIFLSLDETTRGTTLLKGQIASPDIDQWSGALIELWQQGSLQAMLIVNENGMFRHEGFQPGYPADLRINAATGKLVAIKDVRFPESPSSEDE